jgi:hypothetical protein
MADQVSVTNLPDSGSPARVAFDLMTRIQHREGLPDANEARAYYLKLYNECREVVF